MRRKRFSAAQLKRLRNDIDMNLLIQDELELPWKISEGHLRFLCPQCSQFNTATNPRTNLARCFRCQVNFNPIDIVMDVKRVDFLQAVKYLQHYLK